VELVPELVQSLLPKGLFWAAFLYGAAIFGFRCLAFAAWYGRASKRAGRLAR
jgi:hypothetical protein